jgi:hypothetical protein
LQKCVDIGTVRANEFIIRQTPTKHGLAIGEARRALMIDGWLALPLPLMFLAVAGFYSAVAVFLFWLCFGRRTRQWMLSFNGAVAELFSAIMVIFGILIGFVASDVWDRDRRASDAVEREGANLSTLNELASAGALQT